jgi:hypothetical protein
MNAIPLCGSSPVPSGMRRSVVFLPRAPFTRPYRDDQRDPLDDALILRSLATGGVVETGSATDLARLSRKARLPFGNVESALDRATWAGIGSPVPGEGLYCFFEQPERAA